MRLNSLRELQTARGRREQRRFLIDGEKMVREALAAGAPCTELLVLDPAPWADAPLAPTVISRADAERLSDARSPQGVFAVVEDRLPAAAEAAAVLPLDGRAVAAALDAVQDPGNVGAIIRSAAAFGCALVLLGPGCADATHPRVTRAATGAWFQARIARSDDLRTDLASLRGRGARIVAASAGGAAAAALQCAATVNQERVSAAGPTVWLFGNEGAGVSDDLAALIDGTVRIPIDPCVDSLNVAVAAGIILARAQPLEFARCAS